MSQITQHYHPSERPFVEVVQKWVDVLERTEQPKLTDFLDPREQEIVKSLIPNGSPVCIDVITMDDSYERVRLLLHFLDAREETKEQYMNSIVLLQIEFASRFHSLTHPSLLGSLLGLGIKRSKIGDIFIEQDRAQVYTTEELAPFVITELKQVGKVPVRVQQVPLEKQIQSSEEMVVESKTISSLRLDALIASVFSLSREISKQLVVSGKVKVNHQFVSNPDREVKEGDILSVRGYGRVIMESVLGKTKKEKIKIMIKKMKK
jgi:RNA-binding protein YlmH